MLDSGEDPHGFVFQDLRWLVRIDVSQNRYLSAASFPFGGWIIMKFQDGSGPMSKYAMRCW